MTAAKKVVVIGEAPPVWPAPGRFRGRMRDHRD